MTWEMILVLILLAGCLVAFSFEKIPTDAVALGAFCLLLFTGILSPKEAFSVFSNEAPLTVAAMFILSHLLVATGGVGKLAEMLSWVAKKGVSPAILVMMILAASVSAFINNTPVVAVFIPVIMAVARDQGMSPSKFLIPLSYASLLGGCCTLIGTSTNLVVHGVAVAEGHPGFGMFELGKVGLPIAVIGIAYTAIFAKRVLPDRGTVSSILAPEERGAQIYQIMIDRGSPLIGRPVLDFLRQSGGAKLLELRRQAMTIRAELDEQRLQQYDRLTIVVNRENVVRNAGQPDSLKFGEASDLELGIETLSRVKGGLYEGVVTPQSPLIGRTLREFRFRQRHGGLVLAVHRRGHNLKGRFADTPLRVGDTLLLVCPAHAEEQLTEEGELAFNEPETLEDKPKPKASWHRAAVWAAIAAVVIVSTFNWAPISGAAIAACALLVLARITDARSAYRAIDWTIVMLIFGMLALGEAFSKTGLASLIANSAVTFTMSAVPQTVAPYVLLSAFIFITLILTEVMSNNATAILAAPLAIKTATALGVSTQPFLIGVTLAASLAFACPMGYQTHMMVYGPGGYRFLDFFKIGVPLNLIAWITASLLIPYFWPMHP